MNSYGIVMATKRSKGNRRPRKVRSMVVLGMIVSRKGGPMADRRAPRGGAQNEHRDMLLEAVADEPR